MGTPTSVSGTITINPPLSHAELRGHERLCQEERKNDPGHPRQAWIDVSEVVVSGPGEDMIRREGKKIRAYEDEFSPTTIGKDLQEIVDAFPGHMYLGYLELFSSDDGGETWRLVIRDWKVVELRPTTEWPDE